jgi:hypothetical protein
MTGLAVTPHLIQRQRTGLSVEGKHRAGWSARVYPEPVLCGCAIDASPHCRQTSIPRKLPNGPRGAGDTTPAIAAGAENKRFECRSRSPARDSGHHNHSISRFHKGFIRTLAWLGPDKRMTFQANPIPWRSVDFLRNQVRNEFGEEVRAPN